MTFSFHFYMALLNVIPLGRRGPSLSGMRRTCFTKAHFYKWNSFGKRMNINEMLIYSKLDIFVVDLSTVYTKNVVFYREKYILNRTRGMHGTQ